MSNVCVFTNVFTVQGMDVSANPYVEMLGIWHMFLKSFGGLKEEDKVMLLMDEATSHLDPEMEQSVTRNIAKLRCSRLTIAHRRETLEGANRVLMLQNGDINQNENNLSK